MRSHQPWGLFVNADKSARNSRDGMMLNGETNSRHCVSCTVWSNFTPNPPTVHKVNVVWVLGVVVRSVERALCLDVLRRQAVGSHFRIVQLEGVCMHNAHETQRKESRYTMTQRSTRTRTSMRTILQPLALVVIHVVNGYDRGSRTCVKALRNTACALPRAVVSARFTNWHAPSEEVRRSPTSCLCICVGVNHDLCACVVPRCIQYGDAVTAQHTRGTLPSSSPFAGG